MKRLRLSRYAKKRLGIAGALVGAGLMLHSCGDAEAEPQPDPVAVEQFLDALEASEKSAASGVVKQKDKAAEKRIMNLVEDVAERAPSEATINRIETVVAGKLG